MANEGRELLKILEEVEHIHTTTKQLSKRLENGTLLTSVEHRELLKIPSYYLRISIISQRLRKISTIEKKENNNELNQIGAYLERSVDRLDIICQYLHNEHVNKRYDLGSADYNDIATTWSNKSKTSLKKFRDDIIRYSNLTQPDNSATESNDYPQHEVNNALKDPLKSKDATKQSAYIKLPNGAFAKNVKLDPGSMSGAIHLEIKPLVTTTTQKVSETEEWGICFTLRKLFGLQNKVEPVKVEPVVWSFTTKDLPNDYENKHHGAYESDYEKWQVYKLLHKDGFLSANDERIYQALKDRFANKKTMKI